MCQLHRSHDSHTVPFEWNSTASKTNIGTVGHNSSSHPDFFFSETSFLKVLPAMAPSARPESAWVPCCWREARPWALRPIDPANLPGDGWRGIWEVLTNLYFSYFLFKRFFWKRIAINKIWCFSQIVHWLQVQTPAPHPQRLRDLHGVRGRRGNPTTGELSIRE